MKRKIKDGVIIINDKEVKFEIFLNSRARSTRLWVSRHRTACITLPRSGNVNQAMTLLKNNNSWINTQLKKVSNRIFLKVDQEEYKVSKKEALKVVYEKLEHFGRLLPFPHRRVLVKNQTTRWGSASQKGTLSFNIRILFLPEELQNYLVVHELCHLKEMSHNADFWHLVEQALPNYKILRKELRRYYIEKQ